jgi:taspase (threonine aspartase 1)
MVRPELSNSDFSVIVHAGAGYHAIAREAEYMSACRRACEAARARLLAGDGPLAAVTEAIAVLEDDPVCNAGTGSNLTLDGTVECDASVMDADSRAWGGVAAVAGLRNPVRVAALLASDQMSAEPLSCGRVRPVLLCGEGARKWAASRGVPTLAFGSDEMVTGEARRRWRKYIEWVNSAKAGEGTSERAGRKRGTPMPASDAFDGKAQAPGGSSACGEDTSEREGRTSVCAVNTLNAKAQAPGDSSSTLHSANDAADLCLLHDTVGAVCCDGQMRVAAGVSSGGHWLKVPGRMGEAACMGAGCWAAGAGPLSGMPAATGPLGCMPAAGASVSGVGEEVMQALVAKAAAAKWACGGEPSHTALQALRGVEGTAAGIVGLICTPGPQAGVEVVWAHGTPSFALAYLHHGIAEPVGMVSRTAGGRELVSGTYVKFPRLGGGGIVPASTAQHAGSSPGRGLKRTAPGTG